jgi:outer membrane protein OmpA-like peptidoglycan-associated protein
MRHLVIVTISTMAVTAHAAPDAGHKFELQDSTTAKSARGAHPSKISPTKTDAAMKFFVISQDKGPVKGVVIELSAPTGHKYYTDVTDAEGYAETLVPVGQKYELTYLSLGRKDVAASVTVTNEPKQTVKLTLRYQPRPPAAPFVLKGITFETAKATILPESYPQLDIVAEFMTRKRSARLEIAGHTDNVGNPKANKALSQKRAIACRSYLISKGIDGGRITAVGHGDTRPVAPNDTEEGRQQNRRIEAIEVVSP